jgi:hypothetical protein
MLDQMVFDQVFVVIEGQSFGRQRRPMYRQDQGRHQQTSNEQSDDGMNLGNIRMSIL